MTRRFVTLTLAAALFAANSPAQHRELKKPKLVLGIVIDQFRYDYINRFHKDFNGAFKRFFEQGAVFTNAHQDHFPTVTAIGHATFMTGATPAVSGIVNNEWYDRASGKNVTSVSDDATQLLGSEGRGSSPRRLLTSTIGDELKISGHKSKVIGMSIKDRAAILPAGHAADGAYWFDGRTGNFVSSTFYFPELPGWVKNFNQSRIPDKYLSAEWKSLDSSQVFRKMPATPGPQLYNGLEATPFGNDLLEAFAERAIDAEQLGQHSDTDVLTVSFSSNDYVGHAKGPDSPEVRDISLRTDRLLMKLLDYVDSKVGAGNTLVVLTADHGVAPVPEVNEERKMPGGRLSEPDLFQAVQTALSSRFGEGKWIVGNSGPTMYLNRELVKEKNLDEAEVERVGANAVRALPNIFRVYTRHQLINGMVPDDRFSQRVQNGFYAGRSGDITPLPNPYYLYEAHGTSHGTPFSYDTHVPVIFMGPTITPGLYSNEIAVNDIAPTLATILEIEIPSGSVGRVLTELFPR